MRKMCISFHGRFYHTLYEGKGHFLKKSDFYYELPEELIAQSPLKDRDSSRLLCLWRESGKITHSRFSQLPCLLREGDLLILNDSRVIPARLFGSRDTGGAVELVLLRDKGEGVWESLCRPGRKAKIGAHLVFGDGELEGEVLDVIEGGNRLIKFQFQGIFMEILERLGKMPLPPYITEELEDSERYQTVYSKTPGSAAAPTAGLHFTEELLAKIRQKGVKTAFVTLHVGLGTFRSVKEERVENHIMHSEYCEISVETANMANEAKQSGGRVIAVGTTSCRTLESQAASDGMLKPVSGWTDIFIYPGYKFKCIDGLITNFHLPESTLIMLVSALAGRKNVLKAYGEAIKERYRFFSFGDAMLII